MPKPGYVTARSTHTPWKEQEITEGEREVWRSLGVLYEGNATTDEGATRAVVKQQEKENEK